MGLLTDIDHYDRIPNLVFAVCSASKFNTNLFLKGKKMTNYVKTQINTMLKWGGGAVCRKYGSCRSHLHSNPSAFTLVELLVVIAIIGVLIALLLPAVQAAREAARRMQCTNHLKQLGLSMHNHHDSKGVFPPGLLLAGPDKNSWSGATHGALSWAVFVLPYMEQAPLFDSVKQVLEITSPGIRLDVYCGSEIAWNQTSGTTITPRPASQAISTLCCPSCPMKTVNPRFYIDGTNASSLGKTNYVAVCGMTNFAGSWNNNDLWDQGDRRFPNSFLYWNSQTKFSTISDGTSNTLMFAEAHGRAKNEFDSRASVWIGTGCSAKWYRKQDQSDVQTINTQYNALFKFVAPGGADYADCRINRPPVSGNSESPASSMHSGGANFATADGSVHFVAENISESVYRGLGTCNLGESVALP
jgi:prepilin-type N-terminal cleavage/methylation domain-containing protein/prepilin-type processing-associated H-X9-DG protein